MVPLIIILALIPALINGQELNRLPNNLLMGFASSSYQIEGAWNEDGKGENIWDRFTHEHPEFIVNGDNGDVASDSYHKWKEDVELLKNIGAQVFRFSLSWSRILPSGDIANINHSGIEYYTNLIDELLKNEIKPLVTLYHWDLPQPLQDLGGWANPVIIDYYTDFARLAFQTFGDRVKWWTTFNEPRNVCHGGYGRVGFAPSVNSHGIGEYLCAHHIILSHAKAYHIYDEEFRPTQNGQVGITLDGGWNEAASDLLTDIEAAEVRMQFEMGWFANPIFKKDYPSVMRERIDTNSKDEGRPRSRLPVFSEAEMIYVNGTADFLGINHYTTYLASPEIPQGPNPSWDRDVAISQTQDPSWPSGAAEWMKVVPEGIRKELNWVKKNYEIPIFITENGYADFGGIDDLDRINYFNNYLHEILKAIYEDQCNVIGYTAWSLLDSFEWVRGYLERFGLHHIDFNDPNRTRIPKTSVNFFKEVLSTRTLPLLNSTLRF